MSTLYSETSLIQERDRAVRNVYRRFMQCTSINRRFMSRQVAVEYIMQQPAERFYITPKMAERYILGYLRGDKHIISSRKIEMIEDLVGVYKQILPTYRDAKRVNIWEAVVTSPAKCFYITPQLAKEIVFNYRNKHA